MINYDKKAKKIIGGAMARFAEEQGVGLIDTQILISVNHKGEPIFDLMVKYCPKNKITVDDIYPIKFDIAGVKGIITMFIANAMVRVAADSGNPISEINVIMYQLSKERGVELFAYHNSTKLTPLTWAYIFGEEAMLNMVENESNIN